MKNIFITGGCGYVGSVLTKYLIEKGYKITVYDTQWFGNNLETNSNLTIIKGDIRNIDNINFEKLSKSLGFKKFYSIKNKQNLLKITKNFIKINGPAFLEVKVTNSKIKKLPRPDDLIKIKNQFMKK